MSQPRFIQIHTLSSYPAVLLNRDDAGLAKRLPYGGASRIRVSSQCLKRHWRMTEDDWALKSIGAPMAVRSREIIEREILPEIAEATAVLKDAIRVNLAMKIYGEKSVEIKSRQVLLLGSPEIDFLKKIAREAAATGDLKQAEAVLDEKLPKKNLAAMRESAALAAGLTSDPEANTDAAIHVAHAFTVHKEESESDYFTVVDDLRRDEGDAGAAGIFSTELTSGLFYGYVVVDIEALVGNVGHDRALAAKILEHLVHLIATISPGAKKGSTAPYSYADLMLIEAGRRQPRSLAAAFQQPVSLTSNSLLQSSLARLEEHLSRLDAAYGGHEQRAALCIAPADLGGIGPLTDLDSLASWAARTVAGGADA
jgi:CRISPR system Cascade subunit CasC